MVFGLSERTFLTGVLFFRQERNQYESRQIFKGIAAD